MVRANRRRSIRYLATFLLGAGASTLAFAQEADVPVYLGYRSDPVQRVYSHALLGFAIEHRCGVLAAPERAEYERRLNFATHVFEGYVLAKCMARTLEEAVRYPRDMASATIRFSATLDCAAAVVRERVRTGFATAQNFMSLIDGELKKKLETSPCQPASQ